MHDTATKRIDVTLSSVAKLAGVSNATVSRVINHEGNVRPETVRVVRAAMDTAGYVPSFRRPRRKVREHSPSTSLTAFALIVPELSGGLYTSLQKGFGDEAHQLHHQMIVCHTNNNIYKQADEILQLAQKRVAGVAIVTVTSAQTPPHHIQALQQAGIAVVLLHRGVVDVSAPLIALPLEEVGYKAAKVILAKGHKKIAFFTAKNAPNHHEVGFVRGLGDAGVTLPEQLIFRCPNYVTGAIPEIERGSKEAITAMLALPPTERPTAVFVTFDSSAEILYMTLMQMGVRVPQDLSIVSFGGQFREGAILQRLTSIIVDEMQVGSLAMRFFAEIRNKDRAIDSDDKIVLPLSLSDGQTLGDASSRPADYEPVGNQRH